jgi:xanthine dehydrogenase accessory factor
MEQDIFRIIVSLIEERKTFALATVVQVEGSAPAPPGSKMVVLPDGSQHGTVGGAIIEEKSREFALQALKSGKGGLYEFNLIGHGDESIGICGGKAKVFVEIINPKPHVLIFGGGHIGLEVGVLCDQLGYRYSVVDDRAEFSSRERFKNAAGLFNATVEEFAKSADMRPYSHVLICTYGHEHDAEAAEFALKNFNRYVGLVGSKTKRVEIREQLREKGVTGERFDEIHCPVGIKIGAKTPAEIAVSIMAEIIADARAK